jgi:DNA primase
MDSFRKVKEQIDIEQVAAYLGIEVKKHFVLCPFHSEKSSSLRFYKDSFFCFGCGAKGDAISLTAHMLGLSQREANQYTFIEAWHKITEKEAKKLRGQIRKDKAELKSRKKEARNKCLDGTLVHVKSGNKIMVNMPLLLDYLNGKKGSDTDEVQNCSNS